MATLFSWVGALPPEGSDAERARAFDAVMNGPRIRTDRGFKPRFPRLADAMAAGAQRKLRDAGSRLQFDRMSVDLGLLNVAN